MLKKTHKQFEYFLEKYKISFLHDILIFVFICVLLSISYIMWDDFFEKQVFGIEILLPIEEFLAKSLRVHTSWTLSNVLNINNYTEGITILIPDHNRYVRIYPGCSGLKHLFIFTGTMILFPAPWKKKLWAVPLGLIIIYIARFALTIFIALIIIFNYERYELFHGNFPKIFVYSMIFLIWAIWAKYLKKKKE